MSSRLRDWLDRRWPLSAVVNWGLREKIPGGPSFGYIFGSLTLFLFALQVVTGVWQLFYYVPTVDHAYDSVVYLRLRVPFGWLIHGIHYWSANAFVLVLGVHVVRVFVWGAYKRPRELVWLSGVCLLLLAVGLVFSGALLPWDELGYWAGEVGTSISGTVPFVGQWVESLLRGGVRMSQVTLSRFFIFHVAILPALAAFVIGIHVIAFRQAGSAGTWRVPPGPAGRFWPDQVFRDLLVSVAALVALVGLAAFIRAPITGPADPLDSAYVPAPEWPFLFLYQALKAFKGAWEPLGTVGIPLALITLMVLLPFLDRHGERRPVRRPAMMAAGAVWVVGMLALTVAGHYSHPELSVSPFTAPPAAAPPAAVSPQAEQGKHLFAANGCSACHRVNGQGGTIGPDLSNEANRDRSREWLLVQLRQPTVHDPRSVMPSFASLGTEDLDALIAYLRTLSSGPAPAGPASAAAPAAQAALPLSGRQGPPGPASRMVGNPEHGAILFAWNCSPCHGANGAGGVANPGSLAAEVPALRALRPPLFNRDADVFAANIDRFIQHGSRPAGPDPALSMPDFGDSQAQTQPQIANIEAYVLKLNGVDRAAIVAPGVSPRPFFWVTLGVFAAIGLGLGVASRWRRTTT